MAATTLVPVTCPQGCETNHLENYIDDLDSEVHAVAVTSRGLTIEVTQVQYNGDDPSRIEMSFQHDGDLVTVAGVVGGD